MARRPCCPTGRWNEGPDASSWLQTEEIQRRQTAACPQVELQHVTSLLCALNMHISAKCRFNKNTKTGR